MSERERLALRQQVFQAVFGDQLREDAYWVPDVLIEHSWEITGALMRRGFGVEMHSQGDGRFCFRFIPGVGGGHKRAPGVWCQGDTIGEAICRAAIAALLPEEP